MVFVLLYLLLLAWNGRNHIYENKTAILLLYLLLCISLPVLTIA